MLCTTFNIPATMWRCRHRTTCLNLFLMILLAGSAIYILSSLSPHPTLSDTAHSKKTIIIVYNRVPKSGSTSTLDLFQALSANYGKFVYKSSSDYFHFRFSEEEQQRFPKDLIAFTHKFGNRSVLYDQHFHFFNIHSTSEAIFKYINLLRDPLKQTLSCFHFRRYRYFKDPENPLTKKMLPSAANMSMDQCILSGEPARCLTIPYGVLSIVSFFCGQSSTCDDTQTRPISDAAVSLAKANIERYYMWVGVVEYFESSLELLESVEPSLFKGIIEVYRAKKKDGRQNVTPEKYQNPITNATRDILLRLLAPEYELYQFVQKRFIDQYRRLFRREPLSINGGKEE